MPDAAPPAAASLAPLAAEPRNLCPGAMLFQVVTTVQAKKAAARLATRRGKAIWQDIEGKANSGNQQRRAAPLNDHKADAELKRSSSRKLSSVCVSRPVARSMASALRVRTS